jgi:hypothetical protein
MSNPYVSFDLGEAHRAELLRQAERYRRSRPAGAQRGGGPAGPLVRRTLVRLGHALRRRTPRQIAATTALIVPGERHARVEAADSAC